LTAGPWLPITLTAYTVGIKTLYAKTQVSPDLRRYLVVEIGLKGDLRAVKAFEVVVKDQSGHEISLERRKIPGTSAGRGKHELLNVDLTGSVVDLWWPVGYGKQNLYEVEVQLLSEVSVFLPCKPYLLATHILP
jgi:beta-mannosidase